MYCPKGTTEQIFCEDGTYCYGNSTKRICETGFFCVKGMRFSCPKGQISSEGAKACVPCDAGYKWYTE